MKVLIIEDEKEAFENLKSMIYRYDPEITILDWITSVEKAVEWFKTMPGADLVFLDIYLSDGMSFEIFNQVEVKVPIIFTTAYHQYAIRAFETNSVDYLLKPFYQERLNQSIDKFKEYHYLVKRNVLKGLYEVIRNNEFNPQNYKHRFLVKSGSKLYSVDTEKIAYFYRDNLVFLVTFDKAKFVMEFSLDELETLLNPKEFYRINRQIIANIKAIETTYAYSKGKLKLKLTPGFSSDIIISQQRSSQFKKWLDGTASNE